MKINIDITKEKLDELTWDEWELMDAANQGYGSAKKLIARFMIDDEGKDITQQEAVKLLGQLKTPEMKTVIEQFTKKIGEMVNVNPTKSGD